MGEAFRFLKWENDVVGIIDESLAVSFTAPAFNATVSLYTQGASAWTPDQFLEFLSERIVSPNRRDIEKLLFRCGLSEYDVFAIADATHAVHPKDRLWMARNEDDRLEDAVSSVFEEVFHQCVDAVGDSVDTPEGFNVKRYGALGGHYGIIKQRINPLVTDVESEIAVFLLAQEMGVPCCPAQRFDADSVFSQFQYDFTTEYLVHLRRLFSGPRGENELENLLAVRLAFADDFYRMVVLDFVTRQDDRHLSNMALKITAQGESFYPLYDNGRSLFYEDTEETVRRAAEDPAAFATTFGTSGTYWNHVQDIAARGVDLGNLVNLNINERTVEALLREAGFKTYRLPGAREWILRTLEMVRNLQA